MILLNTDEHRQWDTAVDTWPTCQTCLGRGSIEADSWNMNDPENLLGWVPCPNCSTWIGWKDGRVPQPVYIVIEGEVDPATFSAIGGAWVVPARWRVPHLCPPYENCEIRAECPPQTRVDPIRLCPYCQGEGSVLLATGTVEILPVAGPHFQRTEVRRFVALTRPPSYVDRDMALGIHITLDPLPVPGRHFVAVITP